MKKFLRGFLLFVISTCLCLSLTGCGEEKLSDLIGRDSAKQIALDDAGFPERWVIELDVDFRHDNNEHIYKIYFINATTVYNYVVDGDTGDILSRNTSPLFEE